MWRLSFSFIEDQYLKMHAMAFRTKPIGIYGAAGSMRSCSQEEKANKKIEWHIRNDQMALQIVKFISTQPTNCTKIYILNLRDN